MANNDKQYTIYIRSTKERIPVSKEEFDAYYKDINAYRRTQMNRGYCACPRSEWLSCDMECDGCLFRRHGNELSLDATVNDDGEGARALGEDIPCAGRTIEELITDVAEVRQILDRLAELMPEAGVIGELRLMGLSDEAISERIGINRTTFLSRLKKAKAELKDEFPVFFLKKTQKTSSKRVSAFHSGIEGREMNPASLMEVKTNE